MAGKIKKPFKSKTFEPTLKSEGLPYYITEDEAGVFVHYVGGKTHKAEVISRLESGYTVIKCNGKLFDYVNLPENEEEHGKLGELEEFYQMQTTGDIVTKRVTNKTVPSLKKETFAFVCGEGDKDKQSGSRVQIDEQTFLDCKNAYLKYLQNMEKFNAEATMSFSEFVSKKLDVSKFESLSSMRELGKLDGVNTRTTYENKNQNGDGYMIKSDTQHDRRFLTQTKDGEEKAIEILGHKKRPGGYSTIRCSRDHYDDWLKSASRENIEKQEFDGDVNFIVNPEGNIMSISQDERDMIVDKSIEVNQKLENNINNEKLAQVEYLNNLKSSILNKNNGVEKV